MVLFETNLVSKISTKLSIKKAPVLELDYHILNANKVQIEYTVWLGQ